MARLLRPLSRLGIATRLVLLFGGVVVGLMAVSAYIAVETDRQVTALEALNERLETRRQLIELEASVDTLASLLEARQSVVLNQDFLGLIALKEQLAGTRQAIDAGLKQLATRGNVSALRAEIDALAGLHDAYMTHTIEASFVPASDARRSFAAQRDMLRELFATFGPEDRVKLDALIGEMDAMSSEIEATVDIIIPAALIAACVVFMLVLFSIWHPLRRLTGTIEMLDKPDHQMEIPENGPDEFRAINRALAALQARLTAQRDAEAEARENAEKLKQFTDATYDVLWETGPDLTYTWVHTRADALPEIQARALGLTRWEAAKADPETDPVWRRHRDDLLSRRPIRGFEYAAGPEDQPRWWRVSGEPFYDCEGNFCGYRGVTINITEAKRYEEQLRRSQNMEMLGRLTSGVAHDFNNLLSVLSSNLELIARHDLVEGQGREMLDRCDRATQRGRQLSKQLLAIGHRPDIHLKPVDIRAFLFEFTELVRRTLPDTIRVAVDCPSGLPEISIDPGLLQDSLLNLAINARDAMPEGGALTIKVQADKAQASMGEISIAVSDTGCGIEPGLRDRIFEPFFTTKPSGQGTGLGLSMVFDFATRSGGTLDLESKLGQGTTVTMTLPLRNNVLADKQNAEETGPQ